MIRTAQSGSSAIDNQLLKAKVPPEVVVAGVDVAANIIFGGNRCKRKQVGVYVEVSAIP
jgi:hypothetical protein